MSLHIFNSLTRKLELFEPINPPFVGMYVCGPTVYGDSHLGHAKSYVSFDVVYRYLTYLGYKVKHVQNITDVGHLTDDADEGEDKIAKKARIERIDPMQIVESYTKSYFDDMDLLGVLRPHISPRASGHIIEQIELIKILINKNLAYEVNGSVYFDVHNFSEYGKLSGRTVEESVSGTRVDIKTEKKNKEDFALWKKAEPEHLMKWISPWGEGFPGWHIECSAMSMKYLGDQLDIHGGGMENKFPHHECEIAQSEGVTGKQFEKYWLHNNMVTRDGVKMGKSLGNSISLKDAIKQYDGMTIRFFILNSHYRSTLDYSEHALESAQKGLKRLLSAYSEIKFKSQYQSKSDGQNLPFNLKDFSTKFFAAMDEDFATPTAIATLFDLVTLLNSLNQKMYQTNQLNELVDFLKMALEDIFGLDSNSNNNSTLAKPLSGAMELVIEMRDKARREKQFAVSDHIRNSLASLGIELRDTQDGSKWNLK
jgi:cysteinyl-tRNA synthetase